MITEASIRAAQRAIKQGGKTAITLADKAPRGAGRLLLVTRPASAEWYAARYVRGARKLQKIGTYPALTLAQARAKHAALRGTAGEGRASVAALFAGYVASLRLRGAASADAAEAILNQAADVIGPARLARDVTGADISAVLRPVFNRGSRAQADKIRTWMRSAFRWALVASNDYRTTTNHQWGILSNPVDSVPRDRQAVTPGQRWLSPEEFVALLRWCRERDTYGRTVLELLALTGQRAGEIRGLHADQWDGEMLYWAKTKNGRPHAIPVVPRVAEILGQQRPGLLFPKRGRPTTPMGKDSAREALQGWAMGAGVAPVKVQDLRRTWKTLAGVAGLTKVERDLLQNHSAGDVSERHYNRYDGLREKQAAVAKWEAWLCQQMGQRDPQADAGQVVHQ